MFAIHDPVLDPKEMATGGKRPHIHAHAIVTMRSETGGRIETSPQVFRDWRSAMAERAREQGIDMELTDRRELASAPAYIRKQVRPLSYRGRTEHEGTSHAAHARYQAKRSNKPYLAGSERSQEYAALAAGVWTELAREQHSETPSGFAALQKDRLDAASRNSQTDRVIAGDEAETTKNNVSVVLIAELIKGKVDQMREMTRPEFEAYEKRVEAVLVSVEQTLDASDRADFDEVAAAAREVVDIRREYLEFAERQADKVDEAWRRDSREEQRESANSQWDAAVARFGTQAVEIANNVLIRIEHYREGLDRIEAGELPQDYAASYQAGLAREVHRAAEIAVNDDNQYMREFAKTDQDLQRAIELIEVARDEVRRIADGGRGSGMAPIRKTQAARQKAVPVPYRVSPKRNRMSRRVVTARLRLDTMTTSMTGRFHRLQRTRSSVSMREWLRGARRPRQELAGPIRRSTTCRDCDRSNLRSRNVASVIATTENTRCSCSPSKCGMLATIAESCSK